MKTLKPFLIILLIYSFIPQVHAQRSIEQIGNNYYVAGIPSDEISSVAAKQECPNWCWAACIQMVLQYHGLYVDQKEVVQRVYGGLPCLTGNGQQIMQALTGWAPDVRGRYSKIYGQHGVWSSGDIVDQLSRRWPIIVGLQNPGGGGHAWVLTAVYYSLDPMDNPVIDKVALRNPWPGSPSREEMSWTEFMNRNPEFFKVWVNRL
jgi:papain like cysteine protease AvrRpt2